MKKVLFAFLALSFTGIVACNDDKDENDNPAPDACTLPTGSLRWTIGGTQRCADQTLFGDYGIVMTINGIAGNGETMTIELDSVTPGTYEMKADVNSVLYTDNLAMAYQTTDDNPGTLIITKNDTSNNRLEATFTGSLRNPLGVSKTITSGNLKVNYTQ